MKKYFAILLLPLMVASCVKGPKEAVISGTLLNYKDSLIKITSKGITETVNVKADKTFEYKVSLDKPVLYSIRAGRGANFEFYANPGDSTKIFVDFDKLKDGPKYSGALEIANNFLLDRKDIVSKYLANYRVAYAVEKDLFNQKLDSLKNELTEKIKSITNLEIAALENIRSEYFMKSTKGEYPQYNAYIKGVELNRDSIDYSFLDGLDLNNAYHLMFSEYSKLVNTSISQKFSKEVGDLNLDSIPATEKIAKMFASIDKNVVNVEVRNYLKQDAFMEDLSYGEFWKLTDLVNKYIAECQTIGYKNNIEKIFNQKMLIAPGKPAPLFKYKDINGKEYALEDLKGNLVYIDFWATWCGPCRHELPFLEEVEKAYEGKKVIFISMSMDDDLVAWDKMVKEKKMKGLQLHADGAWASTVAKDYQIKGIPTFALIDENGIIISPSAPRPSSGADLVNMLDESLAKIK